MQNRLKPKWPHWIATSLAVYLFFSWPPVLGMNDQEQDPECVGELVQSLFSPGPSPEIKPVDLLGTKAKGQIEAAIGKLVVTTWKAENRFELTIEAEAQNHRPSEPVVRARLSEKNESTVAVDWLVASHPNTFSVANLYLRRGFKPINADAENYYVRMAKTYTQARKHLPVEFRPVTFHDFERMLRRTDLLYHDDFVNFLKTGGIRNDDGEIFAVIGVYGEEKKVYFLDKDKDKDGQWRQYGWGIETEIGGGDTAFRAPDLILNLQYQE